MLVGSEIGAAVTALEAMKPDVLGLNCATGPDRDDRAPALPQGARAHVPLVPAERGAAVGRRRSHALRPHPGRPRRRARALRHASSASTSSAAAAARRPSTSRAVVERIGANPAPVPRDPDFEPGCSSIYSHVPYHQELAYLAVGERTNANGSRKFRDAMLEGDWDTCVQMAREQVKEGAHVLDVCVDYVGRDGTIDMEEIASRFATQAALPLVFDSTEPWVIEAGLQHSGGKAILNSANLEDGEAEGSRLDRMMTPRPGVRRRGHLPRDRRGGPGPRRGLEAAGLQAHLRHRDRALRHRPDRPDLRHAHVPARLRPGGPAQGRAWRRSRRSGGSRPSCPARRRSSGSRT